MCASGKARGTSALQGASNTRHHSCRVLQGKEAPLGREAKSPQGSMSGAKARASHRTRQGAAMSTVTVPWQGGEIPDTLEIGLFPPCRHATPPLKSGAVDRMNFW